MILKDRVDILSKMTKTTNDWFTKFGIEAYDNTNEIKNMIASVQEIINDINKDIDTVNTKNQ